MGMSVCEREGDEVSAVSLYPRVLLCCVLSLYLYPAQRCCSLIHPAVLVGGAVSILSSWPQGALV